MNKFLNLVSGENSATQEKNVWRIANREQLRVSQQFAIVLLEKLDTVGWTVEFLAEKTKLPIQTIVKGQTQSELQKWLRDNHKLHPHICFLTDVKVWNLDWYDLTKEYGLITLPFTIQADSYEEVLEIGLYEGLKLIKEAL